MISFRTGLLVALAFAAVKADSSEEVIKCEHGECVKLHLCIDGYSVTDGTNLIDIRFNPEDPCEHYLLKCCNVSNIQSSEEDDTPTQTSLGPPPGAVGGGGAPGGLAPGGAHGQQPGGGQSHGHGVDPSVPAGSGGDPNLPHEGPGVVPGGTTGQQGPTHGHGVDPSVPAGSGSGPGVVPGGTTGQQGPTHGHGVDPTIPVGPGGGPNLPHEGPGGAPGGATGQQGPTHGHGVDPSIAVGPGGGPSLPHDGGSSSQKPVVGPTTADLLGKEGDPTVPGGGPKLPHEGIAEQIDGSGVVPTVPGGGPSIHSQDPTGVHPTGPGVVPGGSGVGGVPPGPGGVPPGPGGVPPGSGGDPTAPGGLATGPGGVPPGHGGVPTGPGGVPTGPGGVPPGHGGVPTGTGGVPPGHGGVPTGPGGVPPGHGEVPTGPGGVSTGPGLVPTGPGVVPTGPGGVQTGPAVTPKPLEPTKGVTVNPFHGDHAPCGFRNKDGVGFRITGGQDGESEYGEFPWMAAILRVEKALDRTINVYQCGGSLIHPKVVLTGAHCVYNKDPKDIKVRLGEWDTQTTNEQFEHQDRKVVEMVVHEKFNKGNLHYDFALLFLDKPAELLDTVNTICLPPQNFNFDLQRCFASGWGTDVFGKAGKYQVILKKIELPVMPTAQCQKSLRTTRLGKRFILDKSFICAGGEPGKDTCKGDGGSPLVCPIPGSPDRYYQAGIVAWGIGCGESGIPGVYANVALLRNWIDEHLTHRSIPHNYYVYA